MPTLDTHDIDVVTGAIYFVVGRATEGGPASYHLTIAGITSGRSDPHWGEAELVKVDSGYSLGTIQVDLGKRGTWALGSTTGAPLKPGERTYVDAIVEESSKFAHAHGLKYTADKARLRSALLTHGNGHDVKSAIEFIDADTRDSINAWASSDSGRSWIHKNIDYPQIKHAAQTGMDILDRYGCNISEDRRLETIAILAKTENQLPAKVKELERVLQVGGDYEDLLAEASKIKDRYRSYDGLKAASVTEKYRLAYQDADIAAALDRAQAKVACSGFDPSSADADPDFLEAMKIIGRTQPVHALRQGSTGSEVVAVQQKLTLLGITDAHGHALKPDGDFGPGTRQAVVAFQQAHGLKADGRVGPTTLGILGEAVQQQTASLADRSHPGHPLFCQALERVHLIDAKCGRTPDELSNNVAGSLASAAQVQGLTRIDHVVLGENATRAFAVQGALDSPFRRFAVVDILQAVATPLAQSSADFLAAPQTRADESLAALPQQTLAPPAQDAHR